MSTPTFLGLEPLITARLTDTVRPMGVHILATADVAGAQEASLPKPSVRTVYAGHRIVRDAGTPLPPGWAQVEQTWLVVPAVRNVRDIKGAAPARSDVSPILDAVLDALDGWRPGSGYQALQSVTPPVGPATVDGCVYVPLAFTTKFRRNTQCE